MKLDIYVLFFLSITPNSHSFSNLILFFPNKDLGIKQTILGNHFSNWQTNKYMGASNIVSMFAGEADPPPPVGAQDHAIF